MKLWFTHTNGVPIREQMATQIRLAILAGDLKAGDRLPSVRELARRFKLHPNTASAGYKLLTQQGWLESRHGSGVYVALRGATPENDGMAADRLLAEFCEQVRGRGISPEELRGAMERWLAVPRPERVVLLEPEVELRAIVATELRAVCRLPVEAVTLAAGVALERAVALCLPSKEQQVRAMLPVGCELVVLPVRSAPSSLASWLPGSRDLLLGVVSRWPGFLEQARTMLLAAGFEEDGLLVRDARCEGWEAGLESAAAIVCDTVAAKDARLPKGQLVIPFPILADGVAERLANALPV